MKEAKTVDKKHNIYIPELEKPTQDITAEFERKELDHSGDYPFVLRAGRQMRFNANTLMRDPAWMKGLSESARKKQVVIPHGFGLVHEGKTCGINVNKLAKNTNRDFLAATPLHRYAPCRIETI